MIWIESRETLGFDTVSIVTIEEVIYDFYIKYNTQSYIAFVSRDEYWKGLINIKPFLYYLILNRNIDEDLSSIEFGNEMWSGKVQIKVHDYNTELSLHQ